MNLPTARRALLALLVLVAAVAAVLGAAPIGAAQVTTYTIRVVNNTGLPASQVFVALTTSGSAAAPTPPAGFALNQAYPLSGGQWQSVGGNAYQVQLSGTWVSGTILTSLANGAGDTAFTGYSSQPTVGLNDHRYDFSELTFDATNTFNGDVSAVNQIGIPSRLSILTASGALAPVNGTGAPATEYVGCPAATWAQMQAAAPGWSPPANTVWRTNANGFLQLAGPGSQALYAAYPSFQGYATSLAGKTLTVKGYYAGSSHAGDAPAYYTYSGQVGANGSIYLTGTLSDTPGGTTSSTYTAPTGIYIAGSELYGHTWAAGTGYGVYAQNGPYVVGPSPAPTWNGSSWVGYTPPATAGGFSSGNGYGGSGAFQNIVNDVYGWIYGDYVVSYAMGYWGSTANGGPQWVSSAWNTNPPANSAFFNPAFGSANGLPPYSGAWLNPAPNFTHFNVYQFGTSETGTSYGMALGDRFAPQGYTSPEIAYTPVNPSGSYGTWQVELQANNGCAQATGIASGTSGSVNGGTAVTIAGWNFHKNATVTFDGVPATNVTVAHNPAPTGSANSTITATAPPGCPGPANVQVTNAFGSASAGIDTSTLTNAFTYTGKAPAHCKGNGLPTTSLSGLSYLYPPGVKGKLVTIKRAPSIAQSRTVRATTRVFIPGGTPYRFTLKGLPKKATFTVRVRALHGAPNGGVGAYQPFATVKANEKGVATLPALSIAAAASSVYGSLQPEFQLSLKAPKQKQRNLLVLLRSWTPYLPANCQKLKDGLSPCAAQTAVNKREARLIASLKVAEKGSAVVTK